ncbi:hypothetical protein ACTVZO_41355 [Streptomyces sp. IBSNAI002]|uniref:hypothetical protein n=1 Tax=Streptomyces sp. IBSNAI002 TaxID=3457500 RepID=UPI003FD0ABE6
MFPFDHRRKGGAALLGATAPGQPGPFGVFPHPGDEDTQDVVRPVLDRWVADAGEDHPVRRWPNEPETPHSRAARDVLDEMLGALDEVGGDDPRWAAKRREFAKLTDMDQLLEMRGEFAVALALASAGIGYRLGDTKVPNPDLLLRDPASMDRPAAGIEVTARSPRNIAELVERAETELGAADGLGVRLVFSRYPSRLQADVADTVAAAVRAQADAAGRGNSTTPAVIDVDDALKNAGSLTVTVHVEQTEERARWEVCAGELAGPMSSALYAAFEAGRGKEKAAQGRSLGSEPVLLAVDLSRYGAAWMRPAWVWAGQLAASEYFTPDYPFAAIAVFHQSLETPAVLDAAVGISPHLTPEARRTVLELCEALGWAHTA